MAYCQSHACERISVKFESNTHNFEKSNWKYRLPNERRHVAIRTVSCSISGVMSCHTVYCYMISDTIMRYMVSYISVPHSNQGNLIFGSGCWLWWFTICTICHYVYEISSFNDYMVLDKLFSASSLLKFSLMCVYLSSVSNLTTLVLGKIYGKPPDQCCKKTWVFYSISKEGWKIIFTVSSVVLSVISSDKWKSSHAIYHLEMKYTLEVRYWSIKWLSIVFPHKPDSFGLNTLCHNWRHMTT